MENPSVIYYDIYKYIQVLENFLSKISYNNLMSLYQFLLGPLILVRVISKLRSEFQFTD